MFCHLQTHNSHFGDKHEIISIQTYEFSPGKYKKVFCEHHNKTVDRACEECKKLACNSCNLDEEGCTGKLIIETVFECFCKFECSC